MQMSAIWVEELGGNPCVEAVYIDILCFLFGDMGHPMGKLIGESAVWTLSASAKLPREDVGAFGGSTDVSRRCAPKTITSACSFLPSVLP
jgi:hypothetical protein